MKNSFYKVAGFFLFSFFFLTLFEFTLLPFLKILHFWFSLRNEFQGALYPFQAAFIFFLLMSRLLGGLCFVPPEKKERDETFFNELFGFSEQPRCLLVTVDFG